MLNQTEANARLLINKLLEESNWRLVDDSSGKANVTVESHLLADTNETKSTLGDDFDNTNHGFADYVLWGQNKKPLAVLEAKKSSIDPLDAKEQARSYAKNLGVRWIILSNGKKHYQWNIEEGNPEQIYHFPTLESLESNVSIKRDIKALINEDVSDDYVALTQNPDYKLDPRWQTNEGKQQMMVVDGLRFLRDYQTQAIKSIQQAVAGGKKRFLFEMATGTGKTLTSAAIIKLFIKTQNASRVLFLVDRLELENQAYKNFRTYLSPDITTYIFKEHKDDWSRAEVVVTTIQSIMHDNKFEEIFNPNDFDLIISDEAHRAISGAGSSRNVFEYFSGYKLGLTATPKDYLKNLDEQQLSDSDPRELEKRVQFSTYETFGCKSGDPTYRYGLLDGVNDGYLINPYVLDCRTKVSTQLLSEEGYSVAKNIDDDGDEEAIYHAKDFEKKFFSPSTNHKFVELFMDKAQRDPISNEIGKTIIFCVSQNHARKITQLFNEYAHKQYPGKYNSDFAMQITSNVRDAQPATIKFANNNLNGHSKFIEGYKSSKTRICITVGMMTTGYDAPDILNICLMRPIFSPQDFVQIKGRGTRKHTFRYSRRLGNQEEEIAHDKKTFYLFDFFANCEFFENDYPYDETPELPKGKVIEATKGGYQDLVDFTPNPENLGHTRTSQDQIKTIDEKQVGYQGMGVDTKLYNTLRDKANLTKQKQSQAKKEADLLWQKFVKDYEVTYDLMSEVKDLFYLATIDEVLFENLQNSEFTIYFDRPNIMNLLETVGKVWITNIVKFISQEKK
jgi:type I restriction enzyme, R subunit